MVIVLSEEELKVLAEIVEKNICKESERYGSDLDVYKESESYKTKSKIYIKIQSEYFGREVTIKEDSIFGLLDIEI